MVGYGDSLTKDDEFTGRKWCGPRIEAPRSCEPRGVSGETAAAGVERLLADLDAGLISENTDYVMLAWGANDLRRGGWDPEEQIFEPLELAATRLVEAGFVPVFWTPNPQFELGTPPFMIEPIVDERLNFHVVPGVLALASEFDDMPVADLNNELWELDEDRMVELYHDHVHFNYDGYEFAAGIVQAAVDEHYARVPEPGRVVSSLVAIGMVAWVAKRRDA